MLDINGSQHDANGNTTNLPNPLISTNLVYGDHNRLSGVNWVSYLYNGQGQRVRKQTAETFGRASVTTTLIYPADDITNNAPAYSWNAVSDSTWYYLWVDDSTGNVIKHWYTAQQAGCATGAGLCTVTHTTVLAEGTGQWWIQSWNDTGTGPWSNAKAFSLSSLPVGPPPAASLISPEELITENTPRYSWNATR